MNMSEESAISLALCNLEEKMRSSSSQQLLEGTIERRIVYSRILHVTLRMLESSSGGVEVTDSKVASKVTTYQSLLEILLRSDITLPYFTTNDGNTLPDVMHALISCFKSFFLEACKPSASQLIRDISLELLFCVCRIANTRETTVLKERTLSLVTAVLFGVQIKHFVSWMDLGECLKSFPGLYLKENDFCEKTRNTCFGKMLASLVNTMTSNSDNTKMALEAEALLILKIISGREYILLSNALSIFSNSNHGEKQVLCLPILHLLRIVFESNEATDAERKEKIDSQTICILSSLAAKGEDVVSLLSSIENKNMEVNTTSIDDTDVNMPMADDDENSIDSSSGMTSAQSMRARTSARTVRRQDVQTIPKLDQLYHSKVLDARKEVLMNMKHAKHISRDDLSFAGKTARDIGGSRLLLDLGICIFLKDESIKEDVKEKLLLSRSVYVDVVSNLLQHCTGVKPRSSALSPLLSKLAFQTDLLEGFYDYTISQFEIINKKTNHEATAKAYAAITCFCDLFVQRLMTMDDEEFLASYTSKKLNMKPSSKIRVVDVVKSLRDLLYELYWSKPVISDDFMAPTMATTGDSALQCQRARALLSGTKLWNALYERWSRLLRSAKFCEESCWCFPYLRQKTHEDQAIEDINDSVDSDDERTPRETLLDEESDALAASFRDPKMARILTSIPYSIPFERRVRLFDALVRSNMRKAQDESEDIERMVRSMQQGEDVEFTGREQVQIRRDQLYNDSMEQLNRLGQNLKKRVQVSFTNQHGSREAGIDGGGVFKEFLDDLIKDAFDPNSKHGTFQGPLFLETPLQTLSVNTRLPVTQEVLSHYQFLGRVLGKAVYESILVEPQFCLPFLAQLLGKHNALDDLKNLDPELYRNLRSLREMNSENIDALCETFIVTTERSGSSKSQTVELIPGGSSIAVTKDNAVRYIHLRAHRRLNIDSNVQTNAFLNGFRDLIPASWVRLFSPYELQRLIGGNDELKGIDVKDLKAAITYGGGYHPSQEVMHWFWNIVEEMTTDQQRKLLKFITSCSRPPLLGFGSMNPRICICQVRISVEVRLPTSATCMNLLKLPNYQSKEVMKEKLIYAIESGSGFELS
jgi:ubiquitin-protein ligase E3 C